jgi:hypothetical protein
MCVEHSRIIEIRLRPCKATRVRMAATSSQKEAMQAEPGRPVFSPTPDDLKV